MCELGYNTIVCCHFVVLFRLLKVGFLIGMKMKE